MEGQQSLHNLAHPFGSRYFSSAAAPKAGTGCCQIQPRSTNRRVSPCEPVCGPPAIQANNHPTAQVKTPLWAICDRTWTGGQRNRPSGHREYGGTKERQDKGLPSQVTPAQSHLPAVRAVSRRQHRGQNRKENWHLGSGIPEAPAFQRICRGQPPKGGSK